MGPRPPSSAPPTPSATSIRSPLHLVCITIPSFRSRTLDHLPGIFSPVSTPSRDFFSCVVWWIGAMAASTWAAASSVVSVQRLQQGCMALPHPQLHRMSGMAASVAFPQLHLPTQRPGGQWRWRSQPAATESATAVAESPKLVDAPVSIITGASRGIGKAIALALGAAGGKVRSHLSCSSRICHFQLARVLEGFMANLVNEV